MIQAFFIFILSQSALAGCLTEHLKEGIELNQKRKVIYSEMSAGSTDRISDTLLSYEYNLVYLLKLTGFERQYSSLQFPFLCDDFRSTSNPSPPVYQYDRPDLRQFKPISFFSLRRKLQSLIRNRELSTLHKTLDQEIQGLQKEPHFNCMTRHVLESLARVAFLALQDNRRSAAAFNLLKYMPIALFGSKQLDVMAAKHQASGIPILCHDLPLIDYK